MNANLASSPIRSGHWRKFFVAACILVVTALVVFAFRLRGAFRWDLFLATFRTLNPIWVIAAALLVGTTYLGRALRWRVLMRPVKAHPSFRNITIATVIGFTALVVFGRPGEIVRPYLIALKEKVPFSSQLAAWLLERIYDLLTVLLIFGYCLSQIQSAQSSFGPAIQWVIRTGGFLVTAICIGCLLLLIFAGRMSDATHHRIAALARFLPVKYRHRLEEIIRAFAAGMSSTRSGSFVLQLVLYTLAEWIVIVATIACVFRAYPSTASFGLADWIIYVSFVAFGSVVTIPGVGGGMQVASAVILTQFFGLALEEATGLSIVIWLITYVTVVPFGLWLALHEGFNLRKLRELEESAQHEAEEEESHFDS